jgi:hypothetical protein
VAEVRNILDKQVQDRMKLREKQLKEKQDFDQMILANARKEIEAEDRKVKEREM